MCSTSSCFPPLAGWTRSRGIATVISSPVRRAVETAEPAALAAGAALTIVEDLGEVGSGSPRGTRSASSIPRSPRGSAPTRPPIRSRERSRRPSPRNAAPTPCAGLLPAMSGGPVLVVAHNTLLRLGLCALLGLPIAHYRQVFPRLDNAAVTEIAVPVDGQSRPASLLSLNVPVIDRSGRLGGLAVPA